ncbi:hypothetical protein CNMCM5793_005461 [Aspergillus hiratsukae]|uniref:General transcription and DNA repair factor IIH subunit TFB4 n=1 Tax=Aspergillus hiratsukae TaxID=1194566 RepID=A0A8H6P3P8_9EURO|nr:hypothetical protein CNMCM5793_005461 [Aspergillus hiratsukae]KAF7156792.1 hypothetical protein CNMCM6106_001463 [Aspergillus hiratsukae]
MNCIFACQRLHIPIDVCKLSGDAVFLQQASDATKGVYMSLSEPRGLLQYLMMAFLPDQRSRRHLVQPTRVDVDFRAACFCHRRVVDIGFVCSICLSIFCEPPENGDCLTCGTHLEMGDYGAKPAVVARKKKKKKALENRAVRSATIYYQGKSVFKLHLLDYLLEALALRYAAFLKGMSALEAGAERVFQS